MAYAKVLAMVALTPWNGPPWIAEHPERPLRNHVFSDPDVGTGYVVYLVLERERRVIVVRVVWLGLTE